MSSEWKHVRIGEVASLVTKGTTPTTLGFPFREQGVNFVKVETLSEDGRFLIGKFAYISSEAHTALARSRLEENDILFTIAGTIGRTALVTKDILPSNTNQAVAIVRPKTNLVLPSFLRYVLANPGFTRVAQSKTVQSVQANFSLGELKQAQVVLPGMREQQAIAEVLSGLDERITLLRETNCTLEAIAEALFRSWFVDFDPVRAKIESRVPEGMDEATAALFPDGFEESELGDVPRGWRVLPLGDAVEAVGGATPDTKNSAYWEPAIHCWTTPKDLSGLPAPVLLDTERKLSELGLAKIGSGLLPVGSLLLSSRAPIGYLAVNQVPLAINQGYIAMLPGGLLPPLYLLYWCRQNMEVIKRRANGSTFMEISKKAFRPIPVVVPPPELIQAFINPAQALFARLAENEKQAKTLALLRDGLLPRLISGQLRIPEAETQIDALAA